MENPQRIIDESMLNTKVEEKLKIALVDSEMLSRYMSRDSRFPNLALMKISSFNKKCGHDVRLIMDYKELQETQFDRIYVAKIFTELQIPEWVCNLENVTTGGTGFFFKDAQFLPEEIEHSKPDYDLYNEYVDMKLKSGVSKTKLKFFTDVSIGFATRGCMRHCSFCVLQDFNKAELHSNIKEFYSPAKKAFCFLDDNFLAYPKWEEYLTELQHYNKPIVFKQGLDLRLMTEKKAEMLSRFRQFDIIKFAWDGIKDEAIILKKLEIWKKYNTKPALFFTFCGFDRDDVWDEAFWIQDFKDIMYRVVTLMKYQQMPYIMRFYKILDKTIMIKGIQWQRLYSLLNAWVNQARFYSVKSFRQYLAMEPNRNKFLVNFEQVFPELVSEYFDYKYTDYSVKKLPKINKLDIMDSYNANQ